MFLYTVQYLLRVLGFNGHSEIRFLGQNFLDAAAQQGMIVRDKHSNHGKLSRPISIPVSLALLPQYAPFPPAHQVAAKWPLFRIFPIWPAACTPLCG